jgi:L-rhamnose 1-dehydrogenase
LGGTSDEPHLASLQSEISTLLSETKQDSTLEKRFIAVAGDVSKPETGVEFVKTVVEKFGRLDIFVSNAGVCRFEEFLEYVSPLPVLFSSVLLFALVLFTLLWGRGDSR